MKKNTLKTLTLMAALLGLCVVRPSLGEAQTSQTTEAAATQSVEATIELNAATEAQLDTLPGIGPAKAAAIVAYRARRSFRRVEDIMRVRGIGRATFRRLEPMIRVERVRPTRAQSSRQ